MAIDSICRYLLSLISPYHFLLFSRSKSRRMNDSLNGILLQICRTANERVCDSERVEEKERETREYSNRGEITLDCPINVCTAMKHIYVIA